MADLFSYIVQLLQAPMADSIMSDTSDQAKLDYHVRLNASVKSMRFLLRQGLAFGEHDEATSRGNFVELLKLICKLNQEVREAFSRDTHDTLNIVTPSIQKDIVNVAVNLTTRAIITDIGDNFFSLIVDEAYDADSREHMTIVVRYVDKEGCIIERFLGMVHVPDLTPNALKEAIDLILNKHGLSLSNVRGQGYDGASNLCRRFNGLKSLILEENNSAFYVHCFTHPLQSALVVCTREPLPLNMFFYYVSLLCDVVCANCERKDVLRVKQIQQLVDDFVGCGCGLNEETGLAEPGYISRGSHYHALVSLSNFFNPVLDILEIIENDRGALHRSRAYHLLSDLQTFEFVFILNLMINVLAITNELSQALQRKDHDLMNAMALVEISKVLLQKLRESGWDELFQKACEFCAKHEIDVPDMESLLPAQGIRKLRGERIERITHLHHFKVDIFHAAIDAQLEELNDHFGDLNSKLLLSMACLDPRDSFSAFDKQKLCEFARFYPSEFDVNDLVKLEYQLNAYISDVKCNPDFSNLQGIAELGRKMVEKGKDVVYPLVYLLIKLALTLPVATATVERTTSSTELIKTLLRDWIGDDWTNDCMVTYIERDVFDTIGNEVIMKQLEEKK